MASSAHDVRYWVWQRDDQLSELELTELAAQKVDTIYWQAGELENIGETWRWKTRFSFPSSDAAQIRFVPVVRLVSREHQPFSDASIAALLTSLSSVSAKHDELQLDYDAPDRLLADYAAALKRIRTLVPRLTIAALPHWNRTRSRPAVYWGSRRYLMAECRSPGIELGSRQNSYVSVMASKFGPDSSTRC